MQAGRLAAVLLLASVLAASCYPLVSAAHAAGGLIVLRGRAGPGGLAFIHAVLPPGRYRVAWIHPSGPSGEARLPKPMLFSFIPDPGLWRRLRSVPVASPSVAPRVRLVPVPGVGVEVYAWVPARPGEPVSVGLERLGSPGSAHKKPWMVIIVPDDPVAIGFAEKLAALHREHGLEVRVVTTSWIYRHYKPAPLPPTACREGLPKGYNESLALRILAYLRSMLGTGLRYVLLVGGARQVPPIYYCSPALAAEVSKEYSAVPSDYYYADPNLDGVVEYAVGRIPFTNPLWLSNYLAALKRWWRGGGWQMRAFLSGGAPFATDIFFGESAAAKASSKIMSLGLSVSESLLSEKGYASSSFSTVIGRYGLYYLVLHGTGDAMLDYVPGGLWNYNFVEKLEAKQIGYPKTPGVYLTPACRVAFWDYSLFRPPFKPPSIGVAMIAHGAAVAFIASSRVAIAMVPEVDFNTNGVVLQYAGVDAPMQQFFGMLATAKTLGDAWVSALNAYLSSPQSTYKMFFVNGEETIGSLVAHELEYLGDPAAPNPWRSTRGSPATPPVLIPPSGSIIVDASLVVMPMARYVVGTVPAYNPGPSTRVSLELSGSCPTSLIAEALARVDGYTLIGLERLNASMHEGPGGCTIEISVPVDAPGLIRLLASWNGTLASYYMVVGGAYVHNGTLVLRGLDALETIGDEPILLTVNGSVRDVIPGGARSFNITLSSIAPGAGHYVVEAVPLYNYSYIYGGPIVASAVHRLLSLYRVPVGAAPKLPPIIYSLSAGKTGERSHGAQRAAAAAALHASLYTALAALAAASAVVAGVEAARRRG